MTTTLLTLFSTILAATWTADGSDSKQEQKIPARQKYQIMSPQTADFIRYDNTGLTETSGRLDLSIPVISFNDPDFDFPISISYNSAGFKPSEPDNFVGRNWMLNFGGMIYREIKGAPDETSDFRIYGTCGFLQTVRKNTLNDKDTRRDLLNDPYKILGYSEQVFQPVLKDTYYDELSSDIYHFRVGPHSGKFMINFDGSVNVISYDGGHYQVDISKFFPLGSSPDGFFCVISITADDGYRYTFGGSYKALEYRAHSWSNSDYGTTDIWNMPERGMITGFYLTKITAPNGRTLEIEYRGNLPSTYVNEPFRLLDSKLGSAVKEWCQEFIIQVSPYRSTSIDELSMANQPLQAIIPNPAVINTHYGNSYAMMKVVMPERITVDDKEVLFHYSARKHTTLENDRNLFLNGKYCGTVLDSIELVRRDAPETKAEVTRLGYVYTSSDHPRMFLETLSGTKLGRYSFRYKNISGLPSPLTTNIDHWGYWRGHLSNKRPSDEKNSELIPETDNEAIGTFGSPNRYSYISEEREATGADFDWGVLESVTYPTGGSVVFGYEPNDYSSRLSYGTDWYPHVTYLDKPHTAGGVRARYISEYDSLPAKEENLLKRTWYRYGQDSTSSGTLLYEPRYIHQVRLSNNATGKAQYQYEVTENSDGFNMKDYVTDHILYSSVTKQEELSREHKPDSTSRLILSPNSSDSTPIFTDVSVSGKRQLWSFSCRNANGGTGTAYILDRQTKVKLKKYTFTLQAPDSIVFSPADSIEAGDYTIALKKTGNSLLSFNERFPGSGHDHIIGRTTVSTYTDWSSNPDTYDDSGSLWNEKFLRKSLMPLPETDSLYLKRFTLDPEDRSNERGKLLSRRIYDNPDSLLQSVEYKYARITHSHPCVYSNIALPVSGALLCQFFHIVQVPFELYLPESETIREYDGTTVKETSTRYSYSAAGYLSEKAVIYNDGTSDNTSYRYIEDENSEIYEHIKKMTNIRDLPTEIRKTNSGLTGRTMSAGTRCTYDTCSTATRTNAVITSLQEVNGQTVAERTDYSHYDKYSNALQVTVDSIARTIYIWSYLGKHIVARIENSGYDEVRDALGFPPETISALEEPDFDMLDSLRERLPHAHVWTYTYEPLVGMTSETDPAGLTTHYSYDEAGRLTETFLIKNGRKVLLSASKYHLVNAD